MIFPSEDAARAALPRGGKNTAPACSVDAAQALIRSKNLQEVVDGTALSSPGIRNGIVAQRLVERLQGEVIAYIDTLYARKKNTLVSVNGAIGTRSSSEPPPVPPDPESESALLRSVVNRLG